MERVRLSFFRAVHGGGAFFQKIIATWKAFSSLHYAHWRPPRGERKSVSVPCGRGGGGYSLRNYGKESTNRKQNDSRVILLVQL